MNSSVVAVSFGLAAAAYLLLATLVFLGIRARNRGVLLGSAALASGIWGGAYTAISLAWVPSWPALVAAVEALRLLLWFVFLGSLLHAGSPWPVRRRGAFVLAAGVVVAIASLALITLGGGASSQFGVGGMLLSSLVGMILVEQIYRRVDPGQRWGIKHLCIGLGLLFAFDFYLYANGLLFGQLSEGLWSARGFVSAVAVPLLAVSAARNPQWAVNVGVSRRLVMDSVVLTGAGVYLLLMASAGYIIRYVGGDWGPPLQVFFLAGAVVVLLVGFSSGSLRAWLRVVIAKHFFSYKYDYREEWLRFVGTLGDTGSGEPLRVRAIRALAQILDSPRGVLWSVTEHGNYVTAATWNNPIAGTITEPAGSSLIRFLESRAWIIDLEELDRRPDLYGDLEAPSWLKRMRDPWLILPLFELDRLQGFMVLARPRAPRTLNWEDRDLLKTAGRQVASYVALLDTTDALIDSRQFDAFNRVSAFVVHDLKNVSAQLSLVSRNVPRFRDNPEFVEDVFRTVESATHRMNRVLEGLRKTDTSSESSEPVEVGYLLEIVVRSCGDRLPRPELVRSAEPLWVHCPVARLHTVLEHLIRNAQEATQANGYVRLAASRDEDQCLIEIADNGTGMDEVFLQQKLFRPFATTKGNAGMGLGVYEARQFVESVGGRMDVRTRPGEGTVFAVRLPFAEIPAAVSSGQGVEASRG